MRRGLRWLRGRLVAIAAAGGLSVRVAGRFVAAEDAADVDAWLEGRDLPSLLERRANGAARLVAMGGDVA